MLSPAWYDTLSFRRLECCRLLQRYHHISSPINHRFPRWTLIFARAQGAVLTDDTLQALLIQFDLNRNGSFDIVSAPPSF